MNMRVLGIAVLLLHSAFAASAAEIKVLAGSAVQPVMNDIIPAFEKSSGHRVSFDYGTAGGMAERVARGEKADLAVVTGPQMDALLADGKIARGSRVDIGKTGVGVFVRKGAPRPDIASVDSFKGAMLAAKSIGYNDPAAGAPVSIYLLGLFERLGIADQMKPKSVAFKVRSDRFGAVARGDVEIGFNQISEIIAVPEVDLVGPLPEAIQNYTLFSIATIASGDHQDAAGEMLQYLSSPEIVAKFRSRGFSAR